MHETRLKKPGIPAAAAACSRKHSESRLHLDSTTRKIDNFRSKAYAVSVLFRHLSRRSLGEGGSRAFTLLELLVVIGIIALLLVAVVPAFTTIKRSGDITTAAYTIKDTLEQARTYAMAKNTYVWVGFYEEGVGSSPPTNVSPPYSGKGRVLIAAVSSKDGTKIFDPSDPIAALPSSRINPLGKLIKIEGAHITDVGAPPSPTPSPTPSPDSLNGRSSWPYTDGAGINADHYNRVNSDSTDTTRFKFTTQNYTFYKTVRFSPRGEANLNSTYSLKNFAEIGIRPTHGNTVDANTANVVAIQFAGIGGNFRIYQQ